VLQLGRTCKRLHIVMKDDDIWRRLYYQRFVSEEDRRSGKVPVLVDGGIYCKHLDKCGCKKYAPDGDVQDSDDDSDQDDDYVPGSDYYDDYYDYDIECCGETDEECGLFSSWLRVFWAKVRDAKSEADLSRYLEGLFVSFMQEERFNIWNHARAPWWMSSPHF
jgi:hypothetical protein